MPREYNNDDPNVFGNDEDMDEQEATDDGENFNKSIDFDMRNENAKEMKQRNKTKCKCIKPHRPTKFNESSTARFLVSACMKLLIQNPDFDIHKVAVKLKTRKAYLRNTGNGRTNRATPPNIWASMCF